MDNNSEDIRHDLYTMILNKDFDKGSEILIMNCMCLFLLKFDDNVTIKE